MTDHLRGLPIDQVAAWYYRLIESVARHRVNGHEPYATQMLRTYMNNRNPKALLRMPSRGYLRNFHEVVEQLGYHRRVFLSQEEARVGLRSTLGFQTAITRLAGVVPRLRGTGHKKWVVPGQTTMSYESLVQIGDNDLDVYRIQKRGTAIERDLLTSLRGFQLHSDVTVRGVPQGDRVRIEFASWRAWVKDRYDWNYDEYLTMPNPDYGSAARGAVRPRDQMLTVYHANAKRLEDARLAAPYDVVSDPWPVTDASLLRPARVTP